MPAAPAPIVYDLKAPAGVEVPAEQLAAVKAFAEASKLSPEAAQAVLERDIARDAKANADWKTSVAGYEAMVKADAEIGGAKFDASLASAQKALAHFGSPALREALNVTGLGSHPELVRLLAKVGAILKEDGHVAAPPPTTQPKTTGLGGALYGDKYVNTGAPA